MTRPQIILFAKAPAPGFAKTRLIPELGAEGAAGFARRLLDHAVAEALAAGLGKPDMCVTPDPASPEWAGVVPADLPLIWSEQGEGDLGERMARAAHRYLASGTPVLLIGSDCPALDRGQLRQAARRLEAADAVMIPAHDGGYVLLGLRRFDRAVFDDIAWSTASVASETSARCAALGWRLAQLEPLTDIDEPGDLAALPGHLALPRP